MRTTLLIVLIMLVTQNVLASDDWLCKTESSQRVENTINACGLAIAPDENTARAEAFDNARSEFDRICKASSDCTSNAITVTPQRTTCENTDDGVKCYRMVSFVIQVDLSGKVASTTPNKSFPKLKHGVPKTDVVKSFGAPVSSQKVWMPHRGFWGTNGVLLRFEGKMCANDYLASNDVMYNGLDTTYPTETCGVVIVDNEVAEVLNFNVALVE